ncbi:uncharacterized protein F4822DRAFT_440483 [Hypoxylon trugodes]|uniref:uncharacterized protein n=1 Tax=Hypoxylon trugodes TaxID=326681 RepID=UPI0021962DB5|nr:uncharacterized protein F4822DRAFT_440483 [Hypoxylon trugodes]KAI1383351.1 hypothetical protein F4822DRAFT_440483 [Hypoxylon trugodes]
MPRFPVTFRRKSTAAEDPNGPIAEHSFRVLERTEVNSGRSFDGGVRLAKMTATAPKSHVPDLAMEDNLFAGLKNNRGSGSSNTTKTASDNSSRHSNASTAPSSTDFPPQDDWRNTGRKSVSMADGPTPPAHKNSGGFLKNAGRTFSFGNRKNTLPTIPAEDSVPAVPTVPDAYSPGTPRGRSRAETASTVSTATPPKVEDRDFMLDLGGDLSSMLKFDKRASVATLKERSLMANRISQPTPLHLDNIAPVEPPQHSWNSQHSTDGLLGSGRTLTSPVTVNELPPPPVPRHGESPISPMERRRSDEDDEDTTLLQDSIAATQYLSNGGTGPSGSSSRYRRDEDSTLSFRSGLTESYSKSSRYDAKADDDNLFDKPVSRTKFAPRLGARSNSQPQNKVMTPAEFEKYRQDKAREEIMGLADDKESDKEDEDNYDDEEDEREKTKQLAKQRRKQEAHMTVYRQQMMKVTGESSSNTHASRPSLSMSMSTPNLVLNDGTNQGVSPDPPSDGSEEDEEVPLAILAAHGFPNKNRPPTRLTNMSSNPNLRASVAQPSYVSGPGSVVGESSGQGAGNGGRLPPFARKLPQDPYLGAGLINQPPRESFALGGGTAAPNRPVPTGGLVGVIASEERSRALRRGSPAVDNMRNALPMNMHQNGMPMNGGFDPINGIPPQMMYPGGMPQMPSQMLTPGDQAQIQMTQQMQQFMQMQMQFMQMMASQGQSPGQEQMQGGYRPQGHMPAQSMGSLGDMPRHSFLGDPMANNMGGGMHLDLPRPDSQMRTMSMVQPSSASWLQPPQAGYAPSIRAQGAGYAPSIAPSERSNIGLPGRYRPVSSVAMLDNGRTTSMSGAIPTMHSKLQSETRVSAVNKEDDDDDEQGWEAMKAKREKKKSLWRSKKSFGNDIGALIS